LRAETHTLRNNKSGDWLKKEEAMIRTRRVVITAWGEFE
jgi:hypothetical protein